jgi:hypothetical protein
MYLIENGIFSRRISAERQTGGILHAASKIVKGVSPNFRQVSLLERTMTMKFREK